MRAAQCSMLMKQLDIIKLSLCIVWSSATGCLCTSASDPLHMAFAWRGVCTVGLCRLPVLSIQRHGKEVSCSIKIVTGSQQYPQCGSASHQLRTTGYLVPLHKNDGSSNRSSLISTESSAKFQIVRNNAIIPGFY